MIDCVQVKELSVMPGVSTTASSQWRGEEAIVINVPTEPYNRENPDEYRISAEAESIPYDWSRVDG